MPTIAEIISNGELSVPLAANYNSKSSIFSGGALAAPTSPVLIAMVTDALSWMDEGGNYTDAEEVSVANYLVWLCGRFGLQAATITGSGGSVTPVPPGGLSSSRIDFYVSATSIIVTGATSATLNQYIGKEIDFIRGGISQSTLNTEPSYISWTKSTGALTISPALTEGEAITIIPS
jgi:hypothetical protein